MENTTKNFISLVRRKETKGPTQRGFNLEEWKKAWEKSSNNQHSDELLYDAGLIFDNILTELRQELAVLYENRPEISATDLIRAYCGMVNRDRTILSRKELPHGTDITSARITDNSIGNELSLQEVADGCVDGMQNALREAIKYKPSKNPRPRKMDDFTFMRKEISLSHLYSTYEAYWNSLVWADYELTQKMDGSFEIYEIRQIETDLMVAYEASQIRKQKLIAQIAGFLTPTVLKPIGDKACLTWQRNGKKKVLVVKAVRDLDQWLQMANAAFLYQATLLSDELPAEFLNSDPGSTGFTIVECLLIYQLLVILSLIALENFPRDDSVFTVKKAAKFCPVENHDTFLRAASTATGISVQKCSKIVDFLTFKGDKDQDLWCYPLIRLNSGEITFLVAALTSPVVQRVVEHWLLRRKVDLSDKGTSFNETVLEQINSALRGNPFLENCNPASSRRFKLSNDKNEEIDLIFRFGGVIIVGEVKSIVTVDSSISLYRTMETVAYASEQARRKSAFVLENIENVFDRLGWEFDNNQSFNVLPLIITNNSICAGHSMNDVPVCDLTILKKYFTSNIIPLISVSTSKHVAWFEIYRDFNEAQDKLETYLKSPPQLTISRSDFEYSTCRLPSISESSPKFMYTRLIKKSVDLAELIKRSFAFPVSLSPDFKELTAQAGCII